MEDVSKEELLQVTQGKLVLLIEDNEINAQITKHQLSDIGFTVEWVEDGALGLKRFMASTEHYYNLIVTDVMMPVMDGNEMSEKIRTSGRADAEIPIIAITANAYSMEGDSWGQSGINECLLKPYNKQELYSLIYKHLNV